MPALAEVQKQIRNALVEGSREHALPILLGGRSPAKRLAIHQRHYQASLVAALLAKFPGCAWLVGERLVTEAAQAFVRTCPPTAPCIAEYGLDFPRSLASHPGAQRLAYLQSFAELEWHLSHLAIAIELSAVAMDTLAAIDPERLADLALKLQPGVRYLAAAWPVDRLIELFLSESPPERFAFEPTPIALELRGARGTFQIKRVDAGTFAFRAALADGKSIGDAAERALDTDADFDPGQALATLVAENLVTALVPESTGGSP